MPEFPPPKCLARWLELLALASTRNPPKYFPIWSAASKRFPASFQSLSPCFCTDFTWTRYTFILNLMYIRARCGEGRVSHTFCRTITFKNNSLFIFQCFSFRFTWTFHVHLKLSLLFDHNNSYNRRKTCAEQSLVNSTANCFPSPQYLI